MASGPALCPQSNIGQAPPILPDLIAGQRIFERHCGLCHGLDGKGGRGPSLNRSDLAHAPDDASLKSLIETGIPPEMPEAWFLSEREVANLVAFVRSLGKVALEPLPGDPSRGAQIYSANGCSACHILAGKGVGFGPELTEIGARRSAAYLTAVVRDPSSRMPENFLIVEAVTSDHKTARGIRVNEDTFTIQIREARGEFRSLRKDSLLALRKLRKETPMPSFAAVLKPAEVDDLIAFLASLRGPQ